MPRALRNRGAKAIISPRIWHDCFPRHTSAPRQDRANFSIYGMLTNYPRAKRGETVARGACIVSLIATILRPAGFRCRITLAPGREQSARRDCSEIAAKMTFCALLFANARQAVRITFLLTLSGGWRKQRPRAAGDKAPETGPKRPAH
ncbi:hypothetical protein CKO11_10740 [Rhodobacter sp. TJ_12]|nr:hypothetical protein [Rhodobacter sp. TJ_12]